MAIIKILGQDETSCPGLHVEADAWMARDWICSLVKPDATGPIAWTPKYESSQPTLITDPQHKQLISDLITGECHCTYTMNLTHLGVEFIIHPKKFFFL